MYSSNICLFSFSALAIPGIEKMMVLATKNSYITSNSSKYFEDTDNN